jgi:hypothetical protein
MLLFMLLTIMCLLVAGPASLFGAEPMLPDSDLTFSAEGMLIVVLVPSAGVLLGFLLIAPAGIPVGNRIQRMMDALRRAKWRYRRRRRRLVRNA